MPGWNSAALAPRWCIVAVGSAVLVSLQRAPPSLTRAHALGLAFFGYCAVSVLWSPIFVDAAQAFIKLCILALAFLVGFRSTDLKPLYIGFGAGMCVNSVVLIVQRLGFIEFDGVGLFFNPTLNGEAAILILAALMTQGPWWIVIGTWPSMILSGSRAAVAAAAAIILTYLWQNRRRGYALLALASCILLCAVALWYGKFSYRPFERLDIWNDTLSGLTPFGRGIGSFWTTFPLYANHQNLLLSRPEHAHNDYLELTYELGIGAVLAFWLAIHLFRRAAATERRVFVAFAVLSLVGFPLFMPASAFLLALAAGHAARNSPELRFIVVLRRERMVRRSQPETWAVVNPKAS